MILLFTAILSLVIFGLLALHYLTRLSRMKVISQSGAAFPPSNRYQPMLRLLSADDEALLAGNKVLVRKFRKQRVEIFRGYLSSLSTDYGKLLSAVRESMAQSNVDRPDLAAALVRNQTLFALAVCRIEYRLLMTSLGLGSVDVSGLVEAISTLQTQLQVFNPALADAR